MAWVAQEDAVAAATSSSDIRDAHRLPRTVRILTPRIGRAGRLQAFVATLNLGRRLAGVARGRRARIRSRYLWTGFKRAKVGYERVTDAVTAGRAAGSPARGWGQG